MKTEKCIDDLSWKDWVGKEVYKPSKKPFKSGNLTEKVIGLTVNPYSDKQGFKFNDNTIVDCHQYDIHPQSKKL